MDATAFIYDLKGRKGKSKTYLIRKVFGYQDVSNHGRYKYERKGTLTPYVQEKWGRSVVITKRSDSTQAEKILKKQEIPHKRRNIKLID